MQNRAFLKVSPVENVSFFQKEMFEGSYLSSYFCLIKIRFQRIVNALMKTGGFYAVELKAVSKLPTD
jgi:hypothetical protein